MSEWISVLAVEDNELVRTSLKRSLKLYGFKVYSVKNGPAGLQLAQISGNLRI